MGEDSKTGEQEARPYSAGIKPTQRTEPTIFCWLLPLNPQSQVLSMDWCRDLRGLCPVECNTHWHASCGSKADDRLSKFACLQICICPGRFLAVALTAHHRSSSDSASSPGSKGRVGCGRRAGPVGHMAQPHAGGFGGSWCCIGAPASPLGAAQVLGQQPPAGGPAFCGGSRGCGSLLWLLFPSVAR